MEMALVNVVAPGEKVLVVSHGYFGDRFGDLAAAFGIEADVLKSEWGKAVPPAEVAAPPRGRLLRRRDRSATSTPPPGPSRPSRPTSRS